MEQLNLTPQGSINELHLSLDNVFAQIVYGDIPNITFQHCSSDDFEISYQNGVWIIKEKHKIDILPMLLPPKAKLIIVIPHSAKIEKAVIQLSNGCVHGSELHAQNVQLSVRSGSVQIEKCSVSNATVTCESGNIQLSGTIEQKVSVSCNMGNVKLNCLSNDNYGYSIKVGMGSVHIRDKVFTTTSQNAGTGNTPFFDISCEMGNVSIGKA